MLEERSPRLPRWNIALPVRVERLGLASGHLFQLLYSLLVFQWLYYLCVSIGMTSLVGQVQEVANVVELVVVLQLVPPVPPDQ
eukprot:2324124-Pyramimonas_sp.AAC.3